MKFVVKAIAFTLIMFLCCGVGISSEAEIEAIESLEIKAIENTEDAFPLLIESQVAYQDVSGEVINGIYVMRNRGNNQVIQFKASDNGMNFLATSETRDCSEYFQLVKIVPFEGLAQYGLPAGTYLIESVNEPAHFLSATSNSNATFVRNVTFPMRSMLWYITRNANDSYRLQPLTAEGQSLCAPMIVDPGYSPSCCNHSTENKYMQWDFDPNISWYSQKYPHLGWQVNENLLSSNTALSLSDLYFDGGVYDGYSILQAINNEGCHLSSIAMLLANLDVYTTSDKYDVRSGSYKKVFADPYSLTMANLNIGNWYTAEDGLLEGSWSNPMRAIYSYINNTFSVSVISDDAVENYNIRNKANMIKEKLEQHPEGIILRYNGHSAVLVDTTYTSETPIENIDEVFIVCDPGKSNKANGCYVNIEDTGRSISDVVQLYWINS